MIRPGRDGRSAIRIKAKNIRTYRMRVMTTTAKGLAAGLMFLGATG